MQCQKCRAPLKLHSTLENLNPSSFSLLVDSTPIPSGPTIPSRLPWPPDQRGPYDEAVRDTAASRSHRHGSSSSQTSGPPSPSASRSEKAAMSFINVTDSQIVPPSIAHQSSPQNQARKKSSWSRRGNNATKPASTSSQESSLSQKMETSMRLFEILSSRTDIDHPICSECTETLIHGMEKRLTESTKERDAYLEFLRRTQAEMPTDDEAAGTERELKKVREEEEKALNELEGLEREKADLEKELRELEVEAKELDKEEEGYWRERNAVESEVRALKEEQESLDLRLKHDEELLQQLKRVNVFDDAFYVSYAGKNGVFGTINGLRLGRTSSEPVEWAEVNAAWGFACLLLATVADRLKYEFKGYRLKPLGSASSIDEIKVQDSTPKNSVAGSAVSTGSAFNQPKTITTNFPLHYASELPISLPFMHRSFSDGMVAFCQCVRQLASHVSNTAKDKGGSPSQLMYVVEKDKLWKRTDKENTISSIRLGGSWDDWTRACKYVLINCKILLAYAFREEQRDAPQEPGGESSGVG